MKANIVKVEESKVDKLQENFKKFVEDLLDPEKESTAEKAALYEEQEHNEFYGF